MRVVKDPEVRREEILDAAKHLFTTKGYGRTTIIDILEAVGIAKGTFYYYFKSKEEVLDAIVDRIVEGDVHAARGVIDNPGLTPAEKIVKILLMQKPELRPAKAPLLEQAIHPSGAEMRQRTLAVSIRRLAPVLSEAASQGVEQGVFHTDCPLEAVEFLLAAGQVMFDDDVFGWTPEEKQKRIAAFVRTTERVLGAEDGAFSDLVEVLK